MKYPYISREDMIEADRVMVEDLEIQVELMMEHAGYSLARYVATKTDGKIVVVSGSGNNGGGGMVCARRLAAWNRDVVVWLPKGEPKREVPKKQYNRLRNMNVDITFDKPEGELVVDSYIGYNFRGELDDISKKVDTYFSNNRVISLDIPSGIDSNTGELKGSFRPEAIITLAWPKIGLLNIVSSIFLVDIGIPQFVFNKITNTKLKPLFISKRIIEIKLEKDFWHVI